MYVFGCPSGLEISKISEPEKVILFSVCSTDYILKDKKYIFRLYSIDLQHAIPEILYLKKIHPEYKTIFVTCEDDDSGHRHAAVAKATAEYYGYKCLGMGFFGHKGTEEDVTPLADQIVNLKPDVLHINTIGGGIPLANVLWKKGYRGQLITATGSDIGAMKKMGPLAEGMLTPALDLNSELLPPKIRAFAVNFKKRFGSGPMQWAIASYADIYALASAIQQAASVSDVEKIRMVLESKVLDTPYGKVKMGGESIWGAKRQCFIPEFIGQFEKGEVKVVHSVDVNTMMEACNAIAPNIQVGSK